MGRRGAVRGSCERGSVKKPPDYIIEAARCAGVDSPCQKSKRGAVVFDPVTLAYQQASSSPFRIRDIIIGAAPNGQPADFQCTGSSACRENCGKLCMHAEQRAILQAVRRCGVEDIGRLAYLEVVHAKVVDGVVVPGGGPSCWQCSRLVVEVGLRGVWLFEAQRWHDELTCRECRRVTVVPQGAGTTGVCEKCDHVGRLLVDDRRVYDLSSGAWRFYSAVDFHRGTLRACGIEVES